MIFAHPWHRKLMEQSEFYRHCFEALRQRWVRFFLSIFVLLSNVVHFVHS
jgi:hypothetical protein